MDREHRSFRFSKRSNTLAWPWVQSSVSHSSYLVWLKLGAQIDRNVYIPLIQYVNTGSVAFRYTGLVLGPYYAIAVCRILYLFLLLFVVPESLSLSQRYDERHRAKEAAIEGERSRLADEERWRKDGRSLVWMRALRVGKKPLEALAPLAVVLPRRADAAREEEDRPLLAPKRRKSGGRDWNLTLVAIAFALYMIVPVSIICRPCRP